MTLKQLNSFAMKLAYILLIGYFTFMVQGMDDNDKIEMVTGQVKNGEVSINFSGNGNKMITDNFPNGKDNEVKNGDLKINLLNKENDEEQGQKCLICYDTLNDGEECRTAIDEITFKKKTENRNLNAQQIRGQLDMAKQDHDKHFEFHESCMKEWLGRESTCPLCKHNIQDFKEERIEKERATFRREMKAMCVQCLFKFVKFIFISNPDRLMKAILLPLLSPSEYYAVSNINMTSHLLFQFIEQEYHRIMQWGISLAVMIAFFALQYDGFNSGTQPYFASWVIVFAYENLHAVCLTFPDLHNMQHVDDDEPHQRLTSNVYYVNLLNFFYPIPFFHFSKNIWISSIFFLIQSLGFDWNRKQRIVTAFHVMFGCATSMLLYHCERKERHVDYGELSFNGEENRLLGIPYHLWILLTIRFLSLILSICFGH